MKSKVVKHDICPVCHKPVKVLSPETGGTRGDGENRWHANCWGLEIAVIKEFIKKD